MDASRLESNAQHNMVAFWVQTSGSTCWS